MHTLEKFTLKNLIDRSTVEYKDNNAVGIVGKDMLTYSTMRDRIEFVKDLLLSYGIKKGDKVALLSENLPNWGIVYFAVASMGAVIVPILIDFHPNEARHIIHHSESKAVFVSERLIDTIYEDEESKLNCVVSMNTLEIVQDLTTAKKESIKDPQIEIEEDDLATIIYTSGTTGHSKGVMLTNKNIVSNVVYAQTIIEVLESDIVLSILPIPHVLECTAGFLIPIFNGASINYIEKPPTPRILIDAFKKIRPTFMVSVPLIIEKIVNNKIFPNFRKNKIIAALYKIPLIRKKLHKIAGKKLQESFGGRLRFFGIGGAKLSAHVESFLNEADFPFTIGYGLTETAPILAGSLPKDKKARSTGPIMESVEVKIDENGEILAKGPNIMKGYYKDEIRTAEVFKDGWFCTGDLGHIDEDGYLFIVGRSKSVIVGASGENIYPEQIELLINDYEFVVDSLVYQDENRLYARVHLDYEQLDIEFQADKNPDSVMEQKIADLLEKIRLDLNDNVSSFAKIMKFVEQREPFIKTATKKIKRYLYL